MTLEDFWKLTLGGGITVIVGLLLHQIQLGGRKRRRRRDIKEQLELLALLDAQSDVAVRMRRRVEAALERYEPSPQSRRVFWDRWGSTISIAFALAGMIPVMVTWDFSLSQPLLLLPPAITAAAGALALEELLSRRFQMREEDDAAGRARIDLTWLAAAEYGAAPPDPEEPGEAEPANL